MNLISGIYYDVRGKSIIFFFFLLRIEERIHQYYTFGILYIITHIDLKTLNFKQDYSKIIF